jgi:hypothetical protein
MLAPAQMDHIEHDGTNQAALMVHKLAGKPSEEHEADQVRRARWQHPHQVVDCPRRQVH